MPASKSKTVWDAAADQKYLDLLIALGHPLPSHSKMAKAWQEKYGSSGQVVPSDRAVETHILRKRDVLYGKSAGRNVGGNHPESQMSSIGDEIDIYDGTANILGMPSSRAEGRKQLGKKSTPLKKTGASGAAPDGLAQSLNESFTDSPPKGTKRGRKAGARKQDGDGADTRWFKWKKAKAERISPEL